MSVLNIAKRSMKIAYSNPCRYPPNPTCSETRGPRGDNGEKLRGTITYTILVLVITRGGNTAGIDVFYLGFSAISKHAGAVVGRLREHDDSVGLRRKRGFSALIRLGRHGRPKRRRYRPGHGGHFPGADGSRVRGAKTRRGETDETAGRPPFSISSDRGKWPTDVTRRRPRSWRRTATTVPRRTAATAWRCCTRPGRATSR